MTAPSAERFDCIRFVREARARIHEETKHPRSEFVGREINPPCLCDENLDTVPDQRFPSFSPAFR